MKNTHEFIYKNKTHLKFFEKNTQNDEYYFKSINAFKHNIFAYFNNKPKCLPYF